MGVCSTFYTLSHMVLKNEMAADTNSTDVCGTCGFKARRNDALFKTAAYGENPLVHYHNCVYISYIVSNFCSI